MLEDAAGISRVVLACGTVDLRTGIDGVWQRSSVIGMSCVRDDEAMPVGEEVYRNKVYRNEVYR